MTPKLAKETIISTRPDSRGRITLGDIAKGVSRYDLIINDETGEILLKPYKEIPLNEAWLYKNQKAYKSVMKGLHELKEGQLSQKEFTKKSWIDDIQDDEE